MAITVAERWAKPNNELRAEFGAPREGTTARMAANAKKKDVFPKLDLPPPKKPQICVTFVLLLFPFCLFIQCHIFSLHNTKKHRGGQLFRPTEYENVS